MQLALVPPRRRAHESPRKQLWCSGVSSLSDEDLLTLLLRGPSVREMVDDVLEEGLSGLMNLEPALLLRRPGFGEANAASLLAAVELGRRLARHRMPERRLLSRADLAADYLTLRYHNPDQETMGALYLDTRNRLITDTEFYRGTLSRVAVEPRAILKHALLHSASALVLFHTHPSGSPAPSAEDLVFTRRLAKAGELLGVRLVDHIIVGHTGHWVSLKCRGGW